MLKAFKYRLYPTQEQATKIDQTIGVCRLVYNLSLDVKITAYKNAGINLSVYDIQKQLVGLKKEYDWIAETDSQALLYSIAAMGNAYDNFFKGGGYPKFKNKRTAKKSYRTKGARQYVNWDNNTISVPKNFNIKAKLSRKFEGRPISVCINKTTTGKYYISIVVEVGLKIPKLPAKNNAIGIDLGITTFATLSTGEKIDNPRYLAASLKRLKILQRRASKKNKGSINQKKAFKKVAVLHEKIANRRNDFLHKVSTNLIRDNQADTICLETLIVKNMVRNHSLAKAISDVSWAEFVRQMEYKGKWFGKNIIKIDKFFASSKTCSNCGHVKEEMNLSERTWECARCKSTHDRDINAAINIRNSGMGSPGEPVELPTIVGAEKQEDNHAKMKEETIQALTPSITNQKG